MARSNGTSTHTRRRMLNITLVDFLTAIVILVGIMFIKPQFDRVLQPLQASPSPQAEAKQAVAEDMSTEPDMLLLARP